MKNISNFKPRDLIRIGLDPKLFPPEKLYAELGNRFFL